MKKDNCYNFKVYDLKKEILKKSVINKSGNELIEYIDLKDEEKIKKLISPVTGAFVFVKVKDKYLICFNKWRNQWEFPAGKVEKDEIFRQAAVRELKEETNQNVSLDKIKCMGCFKIYDINKDEYRYRIVFSAELEKLDEFFENDEMNSIMIWDLKNDIGYFDEVDKAMFDVAMVNFEK